MAKAILICGKIGSGKTTYAKRLMTEVKAVLLSVDEITLTLFSQHIAENHDEVVEKMQLYLFEKAVEIAAAGVDVILDWGFMAREERQHAGKFFAGNSICVEWHYVRVGDNALHRNLTRRNELIKNGELDFYLINDAVTAEMNSGFEEPEEGEMDVIVT